MKCILSFGIRWHLFGFPKAFYNKIYQFTKFRQTSEFSYIIVRFFRPVFKFLLFLPEEMILNFRNTTFTKTITFNFKIPLTINLIDYPHRNELEKKKYISATTCFITILWSKRFVFIKDIINFLHWFDENYWLFVILSLKEYFRLELNEAVLTGAKKDPHNFV